jgi:hypothetical protein
VEDIKISWWSLRHYKNARKAQSGDRLAIVDARGLRMAGMCAKRVGIGQFRLLLTTLQKERILKNLCRTTGLLIAFK